MSTSLILNTPNKPPDIFDFPIDPYSQNMQRNELTTLIELPREAYRESHGEGFARLTLEGTFGTKKRMINGREESGFDTFERLEKFIDKFWRLLESTDPRISNKTTLEYHDWDRNYHYLMGDVDFVVPRGESNKVHLVYTISATLYGEIENTYSFKPIKLDPVKNVSEGALALKRISEKISGVGTRLSSLTASASGKVQRALSEVDNLVKAIGDFQRGATSVVLFPFKGLRAIGDTVNNAIDGLGDIVTAPITDLAAQLRGIKRTVHKLSRSGEVFKQTVSTATNSLANAYADLDRIGDTAREREDKENGSGRDRDRIARGLTEQSYSGVESVDVLQGDTLQRIAARVYGDSSRWKQIAIINGIGSSTELLTKRKILVPVESLGDIDAISGGSLDTGSTLENTEERLYGTDLKLSKSNGRYGFTIDRALPNPDLVKVKGLKNLEQAVIKKAIITQGSLLEDPLYGRTQSIGSRVTDGGANRMKWSLERAVLADSRISNVSVDIEATGNKMDAVIKYEPIGLSGNVRTAIAEGI